jgi:hypothetical protein
MPACVPVVPGNFGASTLPSLSTVSSTPPAPPLGLLTMKLPLGGGVTVTSAARAGVATAARATPAEAASTWRV